MKNIVIISSSPRINGNSEIIAKEFAKGARDAGHTTEIIDLKLRNVNYCKACYYCQDMGFCYQKDDMNEIVQKIMLADVLVFATPVYFYSMSGQLKVFIDRLLPAYRDIRADIYLIATQMDENKEMMDRTFEAIRGCTRDCFENCEEKGVIYGVELSELGDATQNTFLLKKAYEMGYNV